MNSSFTSAGRLVTAIFSAGNTLPLSVAPLAGPMRFVSLFDILDVNLRDRIRNEDVYRR